MRFLIDDIDYTDYVERDTVEINHQLDDTIPTAKFTLGDDGNQLWFHPWSRVALIDETAFANQTHNSVVNPTFANSAKGWTKTVPQGTITYANGQATMSVNTSNSFSALQLQQTTRTNFVQPNQTYTFSCSYQISGLSNAQCAIGYTLYNFDGSTATSTTQIYQANTSGTQAFVATIPTGNARYISLTFQLQRNGAPCVCTFVLSNVQLELNGSATQTYPTPFCGAGQPNCTALGDGTVVRQKRTFGGFITHLMRDYSNLAYSRMWEIEASGAGILLAKVFCNANYSNVSDQFVMQDLIATYLPNDLTTNNVAGNSGIIFDQIAWQDAPLKDAFNSISKSSNFLLWVDPYFDIHYQAVNYTRASYGLSDNPDMVTTVPFYQYQIVDDGTEMAQRIKVYGGSDSQTVQPALVESFSGDGSTKTFNLANVPRSINNVSVGGTNKKVGIAGKDSSSNYDVLINKSSQTMTFTSAPASSTNNISITYTYRSPSAIRAVDGNSIAVYGLTLDAKIEDSTLITQADIYSRGITALQEYSTPRTTITLYTDYYFSIGDTAGLTSASDNYSNTPFTIQKVKAILLGTNEKGALVCQYQLELGAYRPTFVHHLLHIHKCVKHKASHISATTTIDHIFNIERLGYTEAISTTTTGGVVTYGADTMVRSNTTASTSISAGWNTSSDGETWSVASPTGGTWQIVSNKGKLIVASASALVIARLGSTSQGDMIGLVRVVVSSTAFTNAGLALRITSSTTTYRIRLSSNDSSQGFGIVKTVSGTNTAISTMAYTVTPGTAYWVKGYISGTTLQAKVWADGASEPSGWTITTTDSSITGAGGFGLSATCNNTTDNVQFDSFSVTAP